MSQLTMSQLTMSQLTMSLGYVLLCICALLGAGHGQFLYDTFPVGFRWGTATSAYQIEGGWDADGKGENIWDRWTHECNSADCMTGDVACNSYNQWAEDIARIRALGIDTYRFSLSWARILPNGTVAGGINQPGIDYYNGLIDGLLAEGITPMVTLYHWDLPQALQDIGGWWDERLVQHFADYADIAYAAFGDRVKYWLTFNEPFVTCHLGYAIGVFAPGLSEPGDGGYRAAHTILKSHAEAWHLYNDVYRVTQAGAVSITLDSDWKEPNSTSPEDLAAGERGMQFKLGWFAHPIYSAAGNYPQVMIDMVGNKSAAQGFPQSRLPAFTQTEVDRIRGTYDYFGLNHYTTYLSYNEVKDVSCVSYECDSDTGERRNDSWPTTGSDWLRVVPWGMRKLLVWIKNEYGDVPIIVTENGCSDLNGTLEDTQRLNFYRDYINEALKANVTDNVNLVGYTAWSLMDNFEWGAAYNEKFGMHYVNFSEPSLARIPKNSALEYSQIIGDNGFPAPR